MAVERARRTGDGSGGEREAAVGRRLRRAGDRLRAALDHAVPTLWRRRTDVGERVGTLVAGETVHVSLATTLDAPPDADPRVPFHPTSATVGGLRLGGEWLAPPDRPPALREGACPPLVAALRASLVASAASSPPSETLPDAVRRYCDALEAARDAGVAPLVGALREGRPGVAGSLLGVDPEAVRPDPRADGAAVDDRPEAVRLLTTPVDGVAFDDEDLAVLRAPGNGRRRSESYVVGVDDTPTGFFVHAIDGTDLGVDVTLDREGVRAAMGVDRSLPTGAERLDPGRDERVRLQGDVRLRRVDGPTDAALACGVAASGTTALDRAATAHLRRVGGAVAGRLDVAVSVVGIADDIEETRFHVRADDADLTPGERHDLVVDVVAAHAGEAVDLRGPASGGDGTGGVVHAGGESPPSDVALYRAVESGPLADAVRGVYPSAFRRPVDREVARRVIQRAVRVVLRARREVLADALREAHPPAQVTLPLDGHLAVLGRGVVLGDRDTEPVTVAAPDPTRLALVHDEHDPVDVNLTSGVYEVSLMPRGLGAPSPVRRHVQIRRD